MHTLRQSLLNDLDDRGWRGSLAIGAAILHIMVDHVRSFILRIDRRVRAVMLIVTALLILLLVSVFAAGSFKAYLADTRGPFLQNALQPPYSVDQRPLPALDAAPSMVLPAAVGTFALQEHVPVVRSTLDALDVQVGLLNRCALGLYSAGVAECGVAARYAAQAALLGVYAVPGVGEAAATEPSDPVYVAAVRLGNRERAAAAIVELRGYTRTLGRMGNFALAGAGPVDFFTSSTRGWFSYTWVRGVWLFQASARSQEDLDRMLAAFPY